MCKTLKQSIIKKKEEKKKKKVNSLHSLLGASVPPYTQITFRVPKSQLENGPKNLVLGRAIILYILIRTGLEISSILHSSHTPPQQTHQPKTALQPNFWSVYSLFLFNTSPPLFFIGQIMGLVTDKDSVLFLVLTTFVILWKWVNTQNKESDNLIHYSTFNFHPATACRLNFTWWGCYGLCLWHRPTELAHSFLFCSCVCFCLYSPFNCISFHKFSQQLSTF